MGILDMWREARGAVMRNELADLVARVQGANEPAKRAFFNNISQTFDQLTSLYATASSGERKAILKQVRKEASSMWDSGDWPSALGVGVSALHAESQHVPGEDAAYVNQMTRRLFEEAEQYFEDIRRSSL